MRIGELKSAPASLRSLLQTTVRRAMDFAGSAAVGDGGKGVELLARQAASALYHVTSAVVMAHEAQALNGDARRLLIAQLVLKHRLLPHDPLLADSAGHEPAIAAALLSEAPIAAQSII
jgi:acyl-CoA dehydrogenase